MPTSGVMGADNVDRRLLPRFEASVEHERARRELLPPVWLNADRGPVEGLGDLFDEVLERARERIRSQRSEPVPPRRAVPVPRASGTPRDELGTRS
jgi:hypothetical protein